MKGSAPVLCAYCREPDPKTRDHIPPVGLFPPPRPANLITVPCCERCRVTQSMDDEYFRFAVVSGSDMERPSAKETFQTVRRSLRKPQKVGFARLVNKSLVRTEIKSPGGIVLGRGGAIRIYKKRFNAVAERILRGLFYHERGHPVPPSYEVVNRFRQGGFTDVVAAFGNTKFPPWKKVGNDVFWYTWLPTEEDPDSIAWLQVFYGSLPFMGFTSKPGIERNAA